MADQQQDTPPADDIAPADLGGDDAAAKKPDGGKPAGAKATPPRPKSNKELQAEVEALRAQLAAAQAGQPAFTRGRRYKVSVLHGPAAVVEPADGEHPHETFKAVTGVIHSTNPFEMHEVGDDEPLGVIDPATGKARVAAK